MGSFVPFHLDVNQFRIDNGPIRSMSDWKKVLDAHETVGGPGHLLEAKMRVSTEDGMPVFGFQMPVHIGQTLACWLQHNDMNLPVSSELS